MIRGMFANVLMQDVGEEGPLNCTPPSLNEFPGDFFTDAQRKEGGLVVHFLIAFYIFGAMSIVCHDYFVASIERICEILELEADVAGGTFMAAGGSASELFTAVIGVFISKSDVGVGTVVGSAVFNLLFIVGICGVFAGMTVQLSWWAIYRDVLAYMLSVTTLGLIIYDGHIHWYESLIMVGLYFFYICLMFNNRHVGGFFKRIVQNCKSRITRRRLSPVPSRRDLESNILLENETTPLLFGKRKTSEQIEVPNGVPSEVIRSGSVKSTSTKPLEASGPGDAETSFGGTSSKTDEFPATQFISPWKFPDNTFSQIFWIIMLPFTVCVFLTIPDCRRPGIWRRLYMLTFLMSVLWIAVLSYLMVWMVTIIGDTIAIPEIVMGLTFLSIGDSLPDLLNCIFVAKDGFGDMAVANSVGSNVFDILFCLGLPWLLQTAFVEPNGVVEISSTGLEYTLITLLFSALFILVSLHFTKWMLGKKLGITCIVLYVVFITFACLYQGNVFGQVTLPTCPLVE
ncbi:unnamed protein product [Owenia fusiformis]|uniref:Sodium/calcium exchanger membrane region domain-containing protein n=1 Tax=Owenia fusiformis TaxID=6347 RepID=A0A8J1UFQ0_OWEFU|nr:unnamed protein product [Owenia fusiformis]